MLLAACSRCCFLRIVCRTSAVWGVLTDTFSGRAVAVSPRCVSVCRTITRHCGSSLRSSGSDIYRMNNVTLRWARSVPGLSYRLRSPIPLRHVTQPTRSIQPCIPPSSLNRVPALIGWYKGGSVMSVGRKVTLRDPMWYRARQFYNNISLLFLFPVKDGKLSTGVNATFNASCYG